MFSPVARLNYIGSKYPLLDWLTSAMLEGTGWTSFQNKTIVDAFSGTGIVSYHFRTLGATVRSNDTEAYSVILAHALSNSIYTPRCQTLLQQWQTEILEGAHQSTIGYITTHYSPCEDETLLRDDDAPLRLFFTADNAKRIDYLRHCIETVRPQLTHDEVQFLLASLLVSADAVSNVPAVYGCFLKQFKAKALKPLLLKPIHTNTRPPIAPIPTTQCDVLNPEWLRSIRADLVYLDPPYNERQYSKNYFPLNLIAKTPAELKHEPPLRGKTGIPHDCFLSPFCQKKNAADALETLFRSLNAEWIFLSYSSESLVPRDEILKRMEKYGTVTVLERDYRRFKSFEYNQNASLKEYLFQLHKRS